MHDQLCRWKLDRDVVSVSKMRRNPALEWTEAQRDTTRNYIKSLARLRNAQLPIARLPHELLSTIFELADYDELRYYDRHRGETFSRVSYAWRVVALSTSRLWRVIQLQQSSMARKHLSRCSGGTIEVHSSGNGSMEHILKSKEILVPHIHQLKSLSACYPVHAMQSFLDIVDGEGLPVLTDFELRVFGPPTVGDRLRLFEKTFKRGSFPILSRLALYSVHVDASSGIFENLVELKLYYQWVNKEPSPEDTTIQELLDMLEGCQTLRRLDLAYCGPRFPQGTLIYPDPLRIVSLPALQALFITDEALVISQILAHISLPQSASIDLAYNMCSDYLEDLLPSMFPRDRSQFSRFTDVKKVSYHVTEGLEIEFKAEPTNFCFNLRAWALEEEVDVDEINDENYRFVFPFLTTHLMGEIVRIDLVEEIDIALFSSVSGLEWDSMLLQLPSLRSIKYCQTNGVDAETFTPCPSLIKGFEDGSIPCPRLESLELTSFSFTDTLSMYISRSRGLNAETYENNPDVELGLQLVECLRYRASRGYRLKILKLIDTYDLKGQTVERMRVYVDELEWKPGAPLHGSRSSYKAETPEIPSTLEQMRMYRSYKKRDTDDDEE